MSEDIQTEENQLEELIKSKISAYIGIPIKPTLFTQIEKSFDGETLIVDIFPIRDIVSLQIDDKLLTSDDYQLDSDAGLIYFKENHEGFLELKYNAGLSDSQIELYINPLVHDMVEYENDTGWTKNATSIHEGDVSISIDTSRGKGALIQKNLDELKYMFNTYARMI